MEEQLLVHLTSEVVFHIFSLKVFILQFIVLSFLHRLQFKTIIKFEVDNSILSD